jgi:hypothetical protein
MGPALGMVASTIQAGLQRVNGRRRDVLNPEFRKRINTIGHQSCRVVWFKRGGSWKVAHVHYSTKPDK